MKTREEIYEIEGAALLRTISTYHTLTYEQVIRTFNRKPETIRNLISSLVKQGRIFYDPDSNLICDRANRVDTPDHAIIAAYWVLLDFDKALVYHTSGEFPVSSDKWEIRDLESYGLTNAEKYMVLAFECGLAMGM